MISAKLRLNPLSIYFFPAKYPLIFGNTSCLCCDTTILLLRIEKRRIKIFGKFDVGDDFLPVNHILLLWKYYIYSQKCQKGMPSLQGFIARTGRIYNIELILPGKEAH